MDLYTPTPSLRNAEERKAEKRNLEEPLDYKYAKDWREKLALKYKVRNREEWDSECWDGYLGMDKYDDLTMTKEAMAYYPDRSSDTSSSSSKDDYPDRSSTVAPIRR